MQKPKIVSYLFKMTFHLAIHVYMVTDLLEPIFIVPQEQLVTIYNSPVLPHFSYCSTIWHDNNKSYINIT